MNRNHVALLPAYGLALALAFALSAAALAAPGNPAVSPAPNTHTAPLTTTVSIAYDEAIDPATVDQHTFAVHAMQSGLVQGSYGVQGGTVVLTPTRPFHQGELVYATATTGTLGLDGSAPLTPTVWQFHAGTVATRCVEGLVDIGAGLVGAWFGTGEWGDYDGDGDLDLLVTGEQLAGAWTLLYRNDGPGPDSSWRFERVETGPWDDGLQDVGYSDADWGDYDGDGDLDLLLAGARQGYPPVSLIYRNDGPGAGGSWVFTDVGASLTGVSQSAVAWADYDGDGDLDALVSGRTSSGMPATRIYRNDAGAFHDVGAGLAGVSSGDAVWGDYDGDGDLDLLLSGHLDGYEGGTYLYRNDGLAAGSGWTFTEVPVPLPGLRDMVTLDWGDYDEDGDLDILMSGFESGWGGEALAWVYRNDGALAGGGWAFTDLGLSLPGAGGATWADYDNDGDLDALVVAHLPLYVPLPLLLRNGGAAAGWTFTVEDLGVKGLIGGAIVPGDYDGDGDLDLFQMGSDPENGPEFSFILRNDDCAANVQVVKRVEPAHAAPGDPITYTLSFSNAGSLPAIGVVLTDAVPVTVTVTGVTSTGVRITQTGASPAFAWQVEDLAHGEGGTIEIAGVVDPALPAGYVLANTAAITTTADDGDPADNCDSALLQLYAWQVVATDPAPNSIAPVDVHPAVTFDGDLDPASASPDTFAVYGSMSGRLSGALHYDGPARRLVLTPGRTLHAGETVRATATGELLNTDGERLLPVQWQFTAGRVAPRCTNGFVQETAALPALRYASLAWADYDLDGDVDLFVGAGSVLYRNDAPAAGTGWTWTGISTGIPAGYYPSADWGDYDGDGDVDLLLTTAYSGGVPETTLYRNDGAAGSAAWTFTPVDAGLVNVFGDAEWGDYDVDGDLDILLAGDVGAFAPVSRIYRNDGPAAGGGWTFTDVEAGLTGVWDGGADWGDFDGDGDLDVLVVGTDPLWYPVWLVYRNDVVPGGRAFHQVVRDFVPHNPTGEWGDYDGDGDLDVLLGTVALARNDGPQGEDGWAFTRVWLEMVTGVPAWGDYDNDGDLDVAITGSWDQRTSRLYRNDGPAGDTGWTFTEIADGFVDVQDGAVAWGDYDGDLDLDLALTGYSSSGYVTRLYRNRD
ncbi:MAG: VCBS repeat-containing protein, partial [Anaerolineae bacterium]|nr:VCBS repeat-containing protein [Anaerolineae bacterium]